MRRGMVVNGVPVADIAVDYDTNPAMMYTMWAYGYAANTEYMTKEEAASRTSFAANLFSYNNINTKLTSLEELQWFTSLTSIPTNFAFNCTKLNKIIIPSSVRSIGQQAFYSCPLTNMELDLSNITSFGVGAFQNCTGIKKIILNNNLTSLPGQAFQGCSKCDINVPTNLVSVGSRCFFATPVGDIILENLTTLSGDYNFSGHHATRIKIGNNLSVVPQYCFLADTNNKTLKIVEFGSGITSIGANCFQQNSLLESFTIHAVTPPTLNSTAFIQTNNTFKIYVPAESVTAYQTATNWSSVASRIQAIPS